MVEHSELRQRTQNHVIELEAFLNAFDFSTIKDLIPRYLVNHETRFHEVKAIYEHRVMNDDDKQQSLY
jgi:hypothetical protein